MGCLSSFKNDTFPTVHVSDENSRRDESNLFWVCLTCLHRTPWGWVDKTNWLVDSDWRKNYYRSPLYNANQRALSSIMDTKICETGRAAYFCNGAHDSGQSDFSCWRIK